MSVICVIEKNQTGWLVEVLFHEYFNNVVPGKKIFFRVDFHWKENDAEWL